MILFHAFPAYVPGGFVGVDVFFVISGFLISRIIFEESSENRFSLRDFYARRVRRIFPALVVCLLFSAVAGWWLLLPGDLRLLGEQLVASSLFVANLYFWLQSGYFAPAAQSMPLLHLWSLGVEEQFYIFWPLVLVALRRTTAVFHAIIVIAVVSFVSNLLAADSRDFDFYSPTTRAWELMLGAALAWRARPAASAAISDLAVLAGLAMIGTSCFVFNHLDLYPSWRAAIPTSGAVLVIWGGAHSRVVAAVLRLPSIVEIGRFSYPLYLWHWPLLVFGAAFKAASLTLAERGLAAAAAFLLAWLTYRFVERPFRHGFSNRGFSIKRTVLLGGAGMAIAGLVGIVLVSGNGFDHRFPVEIREIAKGQAYPAEWRIHRCLLELPLETTYAGDCIERTARPLIVLWGDSNAAALMPGFRNLQSSERFAFAQLTASQCEPLLSFDVPGWPLCRRHNDGVLATIENLRPAVVVLHGSGINYPDSIAALETTVRALQRLNIPKIVVLSPVPIWRRSLPDQFVNYFVRHRRILPARSSDLVYRKWDEPDMRARIERLGAKFVSGWDPFCNESGCLTKLSDDPKDLTANDGQHLTAAGSVYLLEAIRAEVLPSAADRGVTGR